MFQSMTRGCLIQESSFQGITITLPAIQIWRHYSLGRISLAGPRETETLVRCCRPLTTDQSGAPGGDQAGPGPGGGTARGGDGERWNGSYHCDKYKRTSKSDLCSHMDETSYVTSYYFQRRFAIHGHNVHLPASTRNKMGWFIYLMHDTACMLLYVGCGLYN